MSRIACWNFQLWTLDEIHIYSIEYEFFGKVHLLTILQKYKEKKIKGMKNRPISFLTVEAVSSKIFHIIFSKTLHLLISAQEINYL